MNQNDSESNGFVDDRHKSADNIFCERDVLTNEASVETFFLQRLIEFLDYPDNRIQPKEAIDSLEIPRGSGTETYKPDYVLLDSSGEPVMVIDAKHPNEKIEDYHYQVSGYALLINQRYEDKNPVRYCILTNGNAFSVYPWDGETPRIYLRFGDFQEDNDKFRELDSTLNYRVFNQVVETEDVFEFYRPELGKLTDTFQDCHDIIWSKEKISPTKAFYEFSKIMFLKIEHDQEIHDIIESESDELAPDDFYFSTAWIEDQERVDNNPVNNTLFDKLREELERQIRDRDKKRIFEKDEEIELKPSTIKNVVHELQNYDLYGIGEDLNGRMFETFLNATIRGEELGQYFTPRSIVEYAARTANISVTPGHVDTVFDGCCGTGGFLIEAMAIMLGQARNLGHLSSRERETLTQKIKNESLWGIDANAEISRIARLNSYLHGDGGNNIYQADALDKEIRIEEGIREELEEDLTELREELIGQGRKFDYILTNPPFSMKYSKNDEDDKRILQQYEIAEYKGTLKSVKSNVLFLERYRDLLNPDGELFTVIDDTVLNGTGYLNQFFRYFLLDNFVIKQVVSLPMNTFNKADASMKTSLLHLKKKQQNEEQGEIFMAIANNIGHDNRLNDTPDRENLSRIINYYDEYIESGELEATIIDNGVDWEPLSCPMQMFTVDGGTLDPERLDAEYYSPVLTELREDLHRLESEGIVKLRRGNEFNLVENLSKDEQDDLAEKYVKYVEINDVTPQGEIIDFNEDKYKNLGTSRAKLQVREGDIVFPKNIWSRGKAFIVPAEFDGDIVTTGFLAIRPENNRERKLIWSVIRSQIFTTQQYYLCVTANQPELRKSFFRDEILFPIPKNQEIIDDILSTTSDIQTLRSEMNRKFSELEKAQVNMLSDEEINPELLT